MFALLDGNNFYASCERAFRPDLNARPVVILSNNDGCAIAWARRQGADVAMMDGYQGQGHVNPRGGTRHK